MLELPSAMPPPDVTTIAHCTCQIQFSGYDVNTSMWSKKIPYRKMLYFVPALVNRMSCAVVKSIFTCKKTNVLGKPGTVKGCESAHLANSSTERMINGMSKRQNGGNIRRTVGYNCVN